MSVHAFTNVTIILINVLCIQRTYMYIISFWMVHENA